MCASVTNLYFHAVALVAGWSMRGDPESTGRHTTKGFQLSPRDTVRRLDEEEAMTHLAPMSLLKESLMRVSRHELNARMSVSLTTSRPRKIHPSCRRRLAVISLQCSATCSSALSKLHTRTHFKTNQAAVIRGGVQPKRREETPRSCVALQILSRSDQH